LSSVRSGRPNVGSRFGNGYTASIGFYCAFRPQAFDRGEAANKDCWQNKEAMH
jgi:hypothetical protein